MAEEEKQKNEEPQESELLKLQREKYEKIIKDKNKIIADLLNEPSSKKNEKHDEEDEEDEEEKAKKDEEERKKKRAEYYKRNLY